MKPTKNCLIVLLILLFTISFFVVHVVETAHKVTGEVEPKVKYVENKNKHISTATPATTLIPAFSEIPLEQKSKYAYVTLMHGIDESFNYRGFLYNAILAKQSLKRLGSTADFIVLVGYKTGVDPKNAIIKKDFQFLKDNEIIVFHLPRFVSQEKAKNNLSFPEMALLKITPFSFVQYESIQFLDGDVLPYKNMDCYFQLKRNTFNTGAASPLNSGWYLAIPNMKDYLAMKELAVARLGRKKWDDIQGWGTKLPIDLYFRGTNKAVKKWNFNGASYDQGLFTHYFILHNGRAQLLDLQTVKVYEPHYQYTTEPIGPIKKQWENLLPPDRFYHYTGRSKPWMQKDLPTTENRGLRLWATLLDSLQLPTNSSNAHLIGRPGLGLC